MAIRKEINDRKPPVERGGICWRTFSGSQGAASKGYIDKEQLRQLLNLPSTRMVDELMRRRKIPFLKLGHKTIRFEWPKVKAALDQFEYRAVGPRQS